MVKREKGESWEGKCSFRKVASTGEKREDKTQKRHLSVLITKDKKAKRQPGRDIGRAQKVGNWLVCLASMPGLYAIARKQNKKREYSRYKKKKRGKNLFLMNSWTGSTMD